MAIPRASRRSSTTAAAAVEPASTRSAAQRAAELLDASEGVYALRKRTRSGAGLDDEEGREGDGSGAVKKKGGKKVVKGKGGAKQKKKTGTKRVATKGRAKKVQEGPAEETPTPVPPTSESLSMPGLVAAAVAAAEREDHDDDDDLSSLTSLSDNEPDALPPTSSPPGVDDDGGDSTADDEGSIYGPDDDDDDDADADADDSAYNPTHPNSSTSRPRRKSSSASRKSSTSSSSAAARPPRAAGRRASLLSPVVEVPAASAGRARKPGPKERARVAAEKEEARVVEKAMATSAQRRPSTLDSKTATARRTSTDFRPLAMPTVVDLYDRRGLVLDQARVEATSDVMLQRRSENAVESAIEALETGAQQTALCLAMNRFSAWCGDQTVQIPVFPLTAAKLALFLARCTSTPLGAVLLSTFPQPAAYPLPLADCLDANLTADEGNRLTRELVKCWVDALSYAQMATCDIWAPHIELMRHHQHGLGGVSFDPSEPHPSLVPLHEDRAIVEVLGALEPAAHMQRYEARMRASISAGGGGGGGVGEGTVALALAQVVGASSAGEMGPPSGTGKDKGKARAVELGGEQARAAPASLGGGGPSGKGKTKWVKGGKAVAPPIPLRGASSSSSNTSHGVPPRSDAWTTATSPERSALSRSISTDWTSLHVPHVNAFADPGPSFLEQAPSTFSSDLGGAEPTFASSFDEQYGEPFEPTSPRLHRRSSTSSLVLQPILDVAVDFPPSAPAADPFAEPANAAGMGISAPHDTASYLIDEQWRLSGDGAPRRSRSVTHAARLENGSGPPASGLDLDVPPPVQAQSSYLPVRFAARQVGQSAVERPAPPPPQQQQQPPLPPEQHPPPRHSPQKQHQQQQQRFPRPRYVEESQSGEQRFVPVHRAPPPARPVARPRTREPHVPHHEPPRHRLEPSRPVKEQPHVVHERQQRVVEQLLRIVEEPQRVIEQAHRAHQQPQRIVEQEQPHVEQEQPRVELVEEYDPTRPQLGGGRLSLPPAPVGASRLHQRRNAIVATPATPEPEVPPAFVFVNGQRYELAPAAPPPPSDARLAPAVESRAYLDAATPAAYAMAGSRAPRWSQSGGEPSRSGPPRELGYHPPPAPEFQAPHDGYYFGSSVRARPPPPQAPSSYLQQPAERVPSWTIPRQAVEPDHFFAQLVAQRTSSIRGTDPEPSHAEPSHAEPHAELPSLAQQQQSSTMPHGYLPHPAYLYAQQAASPSPYIDGLPAYARAPRSSCADKWRRAAPGPVDNGVAPPPLPGQTAYPTPESPSGLFNGGEYPGIGPTTFVPLEGVVAAEIRGGPSTAAVEPARQAQADGPVEGAVQEGGAQGQEGRTAAPMVGLGIGLG
ncbi:hypothetical protein JCM8208_004512 [Rhodotorula glutinis]